MCFDYDSRPPVAPIAGAAISHERLTLTSADGATFAAFAALPDGTPEDVGIVVLPDVRGLYRFYEELALRFAERGFPSIAIDYFGRTDAPPTPRAEDFDYRTYVPQTTPEGIRDDLDAAVAELRRRGVRAVFVVGFCFGGRHAWLAAADHHDGLAGVIGFYGMPGTRNGQTGPIDRVGEMDVPLLGLMGAADDHIGPEIVEGFESALTGAGVVHELVSYPGAPHSFFDRRHEEFADASEDAWRRTLAFIAEHRAVDA